MSWKNDFRAKTQLAAVLETELQVAGMTQKEFAERTQISESTISRLLAGTQRRLDGTNLKRLAEFLKLPSDWINTAAKTPVVGVNPASTFDVEIPTLERLVDETTTGVYPLLPIPGIAPLFPAPKIFRRVRELACQIYSTYGDEHFVVVGVLSGAWMFVADLVRLIPSGNFEIDFVRTSRYPSGCLSVGDKSRKAELVHEIRVDVQGKDVLIVEDIADSGDTLQLIINYLKSAGAHSVRVCVLLDKPECRTEENRNLKLDFVGFSINKEWVLGYGLDDEGNLKRNFPHLMYRVETAELDARS